MKDDLTPFCNSLTFQDKDNGCTTSVNTQLNGVSYENKHEKSYSVIIYRLPKLIQIYFILSDNVPALHKYTFLHKSIDVEP
jgi:hypothetical protein